MVTLGHNSSVTIGHNSIDQTAESLDHSLLAFGYELLVNIVRLTRFIKPAARALGLPWVNWRSLRTSHATWLKMAGADVKDAQAQMRHSRSSTTLDIYQQFVPESQQRVVEGLSRLVN